MNEQKRLPDIRPPATNSWLFFRWFLLISWLVLIFSLSQMTGSASSDKSQILVDLLIWLGIDPAVVPLEVLSFLIRKSAHFTEYLLLAIIAFPLSTHYFPENRTAIWLTWMLCVLYAISDEVHQLMVPGRTGKVMDVFIDAAGAGIGVWWAKQRHTRARTD